MSDILKSGSIQFGKSEGVLTPRKWELPQLKLKHVKGRVVVSIWVDGKNWHTFNDGTKIRLERIYDNFDRRYTHPVNAMVVDAEYVSKGAEILCHHNCTHDVYKIFNAKPLSGSDIASEVFYFSIPETECYAWRMGNDAWQPMKNFDFGLRVFEKYHGMIIGMPPKIIKDCLYMTTGEYSGQVVRTLRASDYCIVFQNEHGREEQLIRCRPMGDKRMQREPEIVAIDYPATEKVKSGEYLVGITMSDAKPLTELK